MHSMPDETKAWSGVSADFLLSELPDRTQTNFVYVSHLPGKGVAMARSDVG
jgi:hypothetical protein